MLKFDLFLRPTIGLSLLSCDFEDLCSSDHDFSSMECGGGRVVRRCWVNFQWGWSGGAMVLGKLQCRGVLQFGFQ